MIYQILRGIIDILFWWEFHLHTYLLDSWLLFGLVLEEFLGHFNSYLIETSKNVPKKLCQTDFSTTFLQALVSRTNCNCLMSTSVKISENDSQKSICFRLLIHVISWMPPNLVRKYVVPIFLSFVCHDINVYDNLLCRPGGTNIWGQLGFGPSNFSSCKMASVNN